MERYDGEAAGPLLQELRKANEDAQLASDRLQRYTDSGGAETDRLVELIGDVSAAQRRVTAIFNELQQFRRA